MLLTVDLIIIVLVWLPTLALRQRMALGDSMPGWADHLGWAGLLVGFWLLAVQLDPGLRGRSGGGVGMAIARLIGPVVVMGLGPQLAHGMELGHAIPVPLMVLWSAAVLLLMSIVRAVAPDPAGPPAEPRTREARLALWSAGGGLVLLGFVPWFPDPREMYTGNLAEFLISFIRGVVRMAGLAAVAIAVGIGLARPFARIRRLVLTTPRWGFLTLAAGLTVILSGTFAAAVLDRMPHVQDEIAMLFQAKNLAAGRLYAKVPPMIEAFDCEFVVVDGDRWYGMYFPAPSLLLALGVWLKATWLVHPVLSAGAILLLFALASRLFGERTARLAVLLALVSPFWLVTFASQMSHPGCLTVMLIFSILIMASASPTGRWYDALLAGLALAVGVWFRPYTVLALSIPWLVYGLVRIVQRRASAVMVAWCAAGALVGIAPLLAYNKAVTGQALVPPLVKGAPTVRMGFGPEVGIRYSAYRQAHTLTTGLKLMAAQLDDLAVWLLGWPRGVLLLAVIGGLWSARRRHGLLMLALGASLPIAYVFFYAGSLCYGPRYYAEALPVYLILAALGLTTLRRALQWLMKRRSLARPARCAWASTWALFVLCLGACVFGFAPRWVAEYDYAYWATDQAVRTAVERDRPKNAIVFVQSAHYRSVKGGQWAPDYYGAAFWMNSPTLDDDVIFARDLDRDLSRTFPPGANKRVLARFPGRQGFRFYHDDVGVGHLRPLVPDPNARQARPGRKPPPSALRKLFPMLKTDVDD